MRTSRFQPFQLWNIHFKLKITKNLITEKLEMGKNEPEFIYSNVMFETLNYYTKNLHAYLKYQTHYQET